MKYNTKEFGSNKIFLDKGDKYDSSTVCWFVSIDIPKGMPKGRPVLLDASFSGSKHALSQWIGSEADLKSIRKLSDELHRFDDTVCEAIAWAEENGYTLGDLDA